MDRKLAVAASAGRRLRRSQPCRRDALDDRALCRGDCPSLLDVQYGWPIEDELIDPHFRVPLDKLIERVEGGKRIDGQAVGKDESANRAWRTSKLAGETLEVRDPDLRSRYRLLLARTIASLADADVTEVTSQSRPSLGITRRQT